MFYRKYRLPKLVRYRLKTRCWYCTSLLSSPGPENGEERVMHMQHFWRTKLRRLYLDTFSILYCDFHRTKHDKSPITAQELFHTRAGEISNCSQASPTLWLLGLTLYQDRKHFVARNPPIDEAVQKCFPTSQQIRLLFYLLYPTMAGHPGKRRMYNSLRRENYLPYMGKHVCNTVKTVTNAPASIWPVAYNALHNCFHQVALWDLSRWAFNHFERRQVATSLYRKWKIIVLI